MGFLFSREAEPRSIKKAVRLIEEAENLIVRNELERARVDLRHSGEYLTNCPITESNLKEMSDTFIRLADDMLHCEMKDDAIKISEKAVQIDPDNVNSNSMRARVLSMTGRSTEALSIIVTRRRYRSIRWTSGSTTWSSPRKKRRIPG
jgi:hypothetical protein